MPSTIDRKLRYLKDRCTNAYWMVRNGKFKLILKSIRIEIEHRIADVQAWLHKVPELDDSQVPGSAFVNKRKVIPPSYKPTKLRLLAPAPLQADPAVVAGELRNILSTFTFQEHENP
jgi:hypothetical protein